jgi:hypothetical protein
MFGPTSYIGYLHINIKIHYLTQFLFEVVVKVTNSLYSIRNIKKHYGHLIKK